MEEDDTIQREKRKNRQEEEQQRMRGRSEAGRERVSRNSDAEILPKKDPGFECRLFTLSTVTMIVVSGFGALHIISWLHVGKDINLYDDLREETWNSFLAMRYITKVRWILWIWIAIYGLQVIWIIAGIGLVFTKDLKGRHLYVRVTLVPATVHVFMMLAGAAVFVWVLLWNKFGFMMESVALILVAVACSYVALVSSVLACRSAEPWLVIQDKTGVLVLIGLFVHNGLAAFATMTCIMANYHLSLILNLEANISVSVTCYVSFGLLLIYLGVYFIIDTCLSDRHAQCVVTPYILACLSYVGAYLSITEQPEAERSAEDYNLLWILSLVGAGAAGVMFVVKIIVSSSRAHSRRVHDRNEREKNLSIRSNNKV